MDFYISMAFSVLLQLLKDRGKARQYRAAWLKIFKILLMHFGPDNDFQDALKEYMPPWKGE